MSGGEAVLRGFVAVPPDIPMRDVFGDTSEVGDVPWAARPAHRFQGRNQRGGDQRRDGNLQSSGEREPSERAYGYDT